MSRSSRAKRAGRKRAERPVTLSGVTMVEVDNPHYRTARPGDDVTSVKITVGYNPRESYVGFLWHQRKITDAERSAADTVRQAFERLGGSGVGAMDYTQTPVDGGGGGEPITEAHRRAGKALREVHGYLGPQGHDLVLKLAGEGRWPRDLAPSDKGMQDYLSRRFRECLECLAVAWGMQARGKRVAAQ